MLFRSNDTATTEIYTLSLHDALPISSVRLSRLFILDGRLFDDERGDVVADGVDPAALGTLDAARVLLQHDLPLTGRADDPERLDELRRDWQLFRLLSVLKP